MADKRRYSGGSLWDSLPRWARIAVGVVAFLWFVPPMVLVFLQMVGGN